MRRSAGMPQGGLPATHDGQKIEHPGRYTRA